MLLNNIMCHNCIMISTLLLYYIFYRPAAAETVTAANWKQVRSKMGALKFCLTEKREKCALC